MGDNASEGGRQLVRYTGISQWIDKFEERSEQPVVVRHTSVLWHEADEAATGECLRLFSRKRKSPKRRKRFERRALHANEPNAMPSAPDTFSS